mgnify:CR=1 FL=1
MPGGNQDPSKAPYIIGKRNEVKDGNDDSKFVMGKEYSLYNIKYVNPQNPTDEEKEEQLTVPAVLHDTDIFENMFLDMYKY